MSTSKREYERRTMQADALRSLGFTRDEADKLRRISLTLHAWHELECGMGEGQVSRSIERDEVTDRPFLRVQYPTVHGYHDSRYPVADREKGAMRRLAVIVDRCNAARLTHMTDGRMTPKEGLRYYVQTDPRGAALYILRPGDVPAGEQVEAYYNRGICVY